jgi:hypothetical protein
MTRQQSHTPPAHDSLSPREAKASRIAARQGLVLRRLNLHCGTEDSRRYDLLYTRYAQPVGTGMKLSSVEAWLGIRGGSLS